MVVDLLRPGIEPIPPDTILWFEFLLDQRLLKEHLRHPNPEPSATDLMVKFLSVDINNDVWDESSVIKQTLESDMPLLYSRSQPCTTKKQLALKILALKIASTLNWNLSTFETKLTPLLQKQLLQDFIFMATNGAFSVLTQEMSMDMMKTPYIQFALILYHRWVLRYPVKAALKAKSPVNLSPGKALENGCMNMHFDKILLVNENSRIQSIKYLEKVIAYYNSHESSTELKQIKVPVMETFVHPTEDIDVMGHNWDAGSVYISHCELLMQIHFDLCYNYFFYGQHDKAREHILSCRNNLQMLENEVLHKGYGYSQYNKVLWENLNYASVTEEDILGYIRALNLVNNEVFDENSFLLQRLQESVANDYIGIIPVLQADNLFREISMVHRQVLELDIQAAVSTGASSVLKDLVIRVSALNAVRYALEGGLPSTHPDFLHKFKTADIKFFDALFWALGPVLLSRLSEDDWNNLRIFILHLATSSQCKLPINRLDEYLKKYVGDRAAEIKEKLICKKHTDAIIKDQINHDDESMNLPPELLTDDWDASEFKYKAASELEIGQLKKHLVEASSADDVRMCLVKLASMSPSLPLWKLSYWKPIGNLSEPLSALPWGFLKDFCVVISGAARARFEAGDARAALSLLSEVESEARNQLAGGNDPAVFRLCRALTWEVLLLQVNLLLSEWPHHRLNVTLLADKCKAAVTAANSNEAYGPRSQVVLAAWLSLLNLSEWDPGATHLAGAKVDAAGVAAALCAACAELKRGKGANGFQWTLWDHVLNTFKNSNGPPKRSHTHPYHIRNYANHHGQDRSPYHLVVLALREPLAITTVLSILAKIYNILVDDASIELVVEYTDLWPDRIANVNNYNPKDVLESLTELLERSLKLYPDNTSWLRLYGDAEMAAGRHAAALRHYLCALAVGSQHFTFRLHDGGVARRMARCCQAIAAPTQAAVVCQLPVETDYTPAFKCLVEKIGHATDSMDAYYTCLYDGTLLEVAIATHARRGEAGRCARAIAAIGALELNSNNSEKIQQEVAAGRQARLLRSLTDQYVC